MTLTELAKILGVPGLVLGIWYLLERRRIDQAAKAEEARNVVESKKADAMTAGFTTLSQQISAHHTADFQSHRELAEGIARIEGIAHGRQQASDATQVRSIRTGKTPPSGLPTTAGYYGPRAASQGDE